MALWDLGARLLWLGREFAQLGIPAHIIHDIQEADFCPRPHEADTADRRAAHGIDVEREDVFHACPDGGSAVIQRLPRGTEGMVAIPFIVDVILIAMRFQIVRDRGRPVRAVGPHGLARVRCREERRQHLAVMGGRRGDGIGPHQFVAHVNRDMVLVPIRGRAVMLRPPGVHILLAALGQVLGPTRRQ